MATKSFTRTIKITNAEAVAKLQNSKSSKVNDILERNKNHISNKTSSKIIKTIINNF